MNIDEVKKSLRTDLLKKRSSLTKDFQAKASQMICSKLADLPEIKDVLSLAEPYFSIFYPMGDEVSLLAFVKEHPQAHYALPVVLGTRTMKFVEVPAQTLLLPKDELDDFLVKPAKRAALPDNYPLVSPKDLTAMLIPGLGFDQNLYRIGYGGAFYDTFISNYQDELKSVHLIGVGYDEQLIEKVPTDQYDRQLDIVVSTSKILRL
ncbi:MAG: 5-formyltetrahydrofolate cyclo-ligase [Coriobacteriia bacterium]|nr:5-formyltetrahydrofolate cyclo-ligase [Coriobacteriia bacterium]